MNLNYEFEKGFSIWQDNLITD